MKIQSLANGLVFSGRQQECARHLSKTELLQCYSIVTPNLPVYFDNSQYTAVCDDNVNFFVQANIKSNVISSLLHHVGFTNDITFGTSETVDNLQCYHISKSLTTMDWTTTCTTHIQLLFLHFCVMTPKLLGQNQNSQICILSTVQM